MNIYKKIILLSYISIASASAVIVTPAFPSIQSEFSVSHGLVEWIMSIFLLGYMIGQLFYGPLANIFGRIKTLRFGLTINLIGIIICLLSIKLNMFYYLLIGRFITAVGSSAGLACTFMILNESLSDEEAKKTLAFASLSFASGIGIAVLLGGLVTYYFDWYYCLVILLIHGMIMYLSTFLFDETLKCRSNNSIFNVMTSYFIALLNIKIVVFSLALGCVSVFSYCFSAAAPFITHHIFSLNASEYGYWNLLNIAGMIIGSILASIAMQKYSSISVLKGGLGLLLTCIIITLICYSVGLLNSSSFFILMAISYASGSFIFPSASFIASNSIECRANASGAMNFINMGSAVLTVSIMGYLPLSIFFAFITIVGVFIISSLLMILALDYKR